MVKLQPTERNMVGVKLFLAATLLVLVCLLGFVGGIIGMLMAEVCLGLIVILTVALWLMIRLDASVNKRRMHEEPSKPVELPVASKPDEILPPAAAREWLDDFLVKQQNEDDLPAGL